MAKQPQKQPQIHEKTMSNFDKTTSTSDVFSVGSEQLLTELTPEQAAVIEGGAFLIVDALQAITAGADGFPSGNDDTYITVNGQRLGGEIGFTTGQRSDIGLGAAFGNSARVELFDADSGFNGKDDNLGGFTVTGGPTVGQAITRVSGSGSTYDVYYRVV